jgi:hypothetical protein
MMNFLQTCVDSFWALKEAYPTTATCIGLMILAFCQNVSFSIVSRSRNRNHITYHLIAAIFSNGVWFCTFKMLVTNNMDFYMFVPYTVGTVSGSICGVKISQWIEQMLGATSDDHIKKKA